jgi:16S rRNA (guanine527-N7)-methyltransferase
MTISIKKLVSAETIEKFKIYEQLLRAWNRRTSLVQQDTLSDFDHRHLLDSLQLIPIMANTPFLMPFSINQDNLSVIHCEILEEHGEKLDLPSPNKNTDFILDVGTGAGFPGMVLAMCGFKRVSLCESNQKKCFFLEEVARQTDTHVTIINNRIEKVREKFNFIVSRACMDLESLLEILHNLSATGSFSSYGLFHKGRSWQEEVALAQKKWQFSGSFTKSVTSKDGVILRISHVKRR